MTHRPCMLPNNTHQAIPRAEQSTTALSHTAEDDTQRYGDFFMLRNCTIPALIVTTTNTSQTTRSAPVSGLTSPAVRPNHRFTADWTFTHHIVSYSGAPLSSDRMHHPFQGPLRQYTEPNLSKHDEHEPHQYCNNHDQPQGEFLEHA